MLSARVKLLTLLLLCLACCSCQANPSPTTTVATQLPTIAPSPASPSPTATETPVPGTVHSLWDAVDRWLEVKSPTQLPSNFIEAKDLKWLTETEEEVEGVKGKKYANGDIIIRCGVLKLTVEEAEKKVAEYLSATGISKKFSYLYGEEEVSYIAIADDAETMLYYLAESMMGDVPW